MKKSALQKGFSLIEIMVVIVIIGLLATLVAPKFLGQIDDARIKRAYADFKSIQTALNLYRIDNYVYPTSEQGLEALLVQPTLSPVPRNWRSTGYVEQLPIDPWERPYLYISPGETREYDIYTLGADGVTGGEGANADISVWQELAVE